MPYTPRKTRLSSRGQVVIPKEVREHLQFQEGQELTVVIHGPGIVLQPAATGDTVSVPAVHEQQPDYRAPEQLLPPTGADLVKRIRAVSTLRELRRHILGADFVGSYDWEALWWQAVEERR